MAKNSDLGVLTDNGASQRITATSEMTQAWCKIR
jgi:hypothetical protein